MDSDEMNIRMNIKDLIAQLANDLLNEHPLHDDTYLNNILHPTFNPNSNSFTYGMFFPQFNIIENLFEFDEFYNFNNIDMIPPFNDNKINVVTTKKFNEFSREHSDECCSICLETNNDSVKLPCGHHFHEDCIGKWLLEKSVNCPMCKFDCNKSAY